MRNPALGLRCGRCPTLRAGERPASHLAHIDNVPDRLQFGQNAGGDGDAAPQRNTDLVVPVHVQDDIDLAASLGFPLQQRPNAVQRRTVVHEYPQSGARVADGGFERLDFRRGKADLLPVRGKVAGEQQRRRTVEQQPGGLEGSENTRTSCWPELSEIITNANRAPRCEVRSCLAIIVPAILTREVPLFARSGNSSIRFRFSRS